MAVTYRTILPIAVLCASLFCAVPGFCADAGQQENRMEGSIYAYSESDIPAIFFFPKEKSRWDGTKVTMREWYMLSDLQKEKFISEYLGEMRSQYQGVIDAAGIDYLKALNLFSYYSNEKARNEPSTKFIDLILEGEAKGGIVPKK